MVEKLMVEVGFLVEKEGVGCGGVVVGMEEEMEERMVEELVAEMVEMVASQGGYDDLFFWGCCSLAAGDEEGKKGKMKERERRGCIYKGEL